ncbi:unnamed protein product [Blepharisma stoltei]|uniref:Uncharacterized protein n=1 Tax=Blepharisma stoltei TaxID=1481888 RepID=A0AAU9J8Y9_9CILI|nr:unnamed protein product [Blepharisma stoltei]
MARQFNPHTLDLFTKLGASPDLNLGTNTSIHSPQRSITSSQYDMSPKANSTTSKNFYITENRRSRALSAISYNDAAIAPRVKSPIPLNKQIGRPDFTKAAYDVHQNRFVSFDMSPPIFTKVRHSATPDISKYSGRDFNKIYGDLSEQPSYDPNYELVWRKTSKGIPFNKILGRKTNHQITMSDFTADFINYSRVDPKVQSPVLDRNPSRPCDTVLPAFMLNRADRNGLKIMTIKTLNMNNYRDRELRPLTSSFGSGWTPAPPKSSGHRGRSPKIVKMLAKKLRQEKIIYQKFSEKDSDGGKSEKPAKLSYSMR